MKCAKVLHYTRASVLALSLIFMPLTPIAFAQVGEPTAVPDVKHADTQRDYTGLWGLLGLLGLAGLIRRRRPEDVEVYDTPMTSRTATHTDLAP